MGTTPTMAGAVLTGVVTGFMAVSGVTVLAPGKNSILPLVNINKPGVFLFQTILQACDVPESETVHLWVSHECLSSKIQWA